MATELDLKTVLTKTADSIRKKKGTTALIKPVDFPTEIDTIGGGTISSENIVISSADGFELLAPNEYGSVFLDLYSYYTDGNCYVGVSPDITIPLTYGTHYFIVVTRLNSKKIVVSGNYPEGSGTAMINASQSVYLFWEWGSSYNLDVELDRVTF